MYVSIDIEADGPVPGLNSMIALGAAAFTPEGELQSSWYRTLQPLPDATQGADTMAWWQTQPEAWEEVTRNPEDPSLTIPGFVKWISCLPGRVIAVASPAAYDFPWVNYYCWRFTGSNPLGYSCLDMGSYARGMGLDGKERRAIQESTDKTGLRPHIAVDDAVEQGRYWIALLAKGRAGAR